MKKVSSVFLFYLFFIPLCKAQDTVLVSAENTVYVTFPEKILLVDIGKFEDYAGEVSNEKLLKLKALKPNAGISSIMVQYGDVFKQFFLKAVSNPKKFHYDFNTMDNREKKDAILSNNQSATEEKKKDKEEGRSQRGKKELTEKQRRVIETPAEDYTMGFISDFLQAAVTVVRNDKENTYLKIYLYNKSSIPYKFDFISFQYFQSMNKGFGKEKRKAPQDVFPVIGPESTEVAPLSKTNICYAIPQFGLANNGYLLVNFREKTGDRVLKIKIKTAQIQSAKPIQ